MKNLGLAETKTKADNALPRSGGEVTGDIMISTDSEITWRRNTDMAAIGFKNTGDGDTDSYMWFKTGDNGNEYFKWQHTLYGGTTTEWMSLKSDNLRVKGHQVYHEGYKPTAEVIQAEPRFNKTIDLTGLSPDRYYPIWWKFPSNSRGANSWLTIHRNYAEDRDDKNPFGKETHLAGLELQIEGSDASWGGDSHYLNIKRIYQRYRNTVKKIQYGMMSIARPVNGKYPLYYDWKSGQIVECHVYSGCYLRGGLTYHVTSNFSEVKYSRKEGEVEIGSNSSDYDKKEIKWTVKSYSIDDPLLGKDYENIVLPYAHDYADTINLAKNAAPKASQEEVVVGHLTVNSIHDWSGVTLRKPDGRFCLIETNPHGSNPLNFIYREPDNQNISVASLPIGTGTLALEDRSYSKIESDNKYLEKQSTGYAQVGALNINNGGNWPGLVYSAENGYKIGIEGSEGKLLSFWANDPQNNRRYTLSTPQKTGTLATLDDIIANKSTAKKEPNGWWKCGDTGVIYQWGRTRVLQGSEKISVQLPISFSSTNYSVVVQPINHRDGDGLASGYAQIINAESFNMINAYANDGWSLPYYWIAIGC
ncbi:gp53-like domain-containing protein [Xenorhabdus lircayensis]|uniref:gp53-like domain-containing protein n=1 Tax=Xenorhabdus lircayensis TaxID=2763499 RepID=UPI001E3F153B|nr:hypothetical protein [Xenorhabdus lircayensis]